MAWGLENQTLSFAHKSAFVKEASGLGGVLNDIINALASNKAFRYDFYLERDNPHSDSYVNPHRNGYNFCNQIIGAINNEYMVYTKTQDNWFGDDEWNYLQPNVNTTTSDDIKGLTLGQEPRSAIEYCYNKNKRRADGSIITSSYEGGVNTGLVSWYLPAIDEIEEIVMSKYGDNENTYSRFIDFQNKYVSIRQSTY